MLSLKHLGYPSLPKRWGGTQSTAFHVFSTQPHDVGNTRFLSSSLGNVSIPIGIPQSSLVAQSCPTLQPHGLQDARLLCPSPTPRAYSNSCPLRQWCHPTISSSVAPFSSCLQSFPSSGSFPMSQFFASGGQSVQYGLFIRSWMAVVWVTSEWGQLKAGVILYSIMWRVE